MGEMLSIVSLGNSYYLEYANENTNWEPKVRELSSNEVQQYRDLMEDLSNEEDALLRTFIK